MLFREILTIVASWSFNCRRLLVFVVVDWDRYMYFVLQCVAVEPVYHILIEQICIDRSDFLELERHKPVIRLLHYLYINAREILLMVGGNDE